MAQADSNHSTAPANSNASAGRYLASLSTAIAGINGIIHSMEGVATLSRQIDPPELAMAFLMVTGKIEGPMKELRQFRQGLRDESKRIRNEFFDICYRTCTLTEPECKGGCEIVTYDMMFDPDARAFPAEWLYGPDGAPCCTACVPRSEKEE